MFSNRFPKDPDVYHLWKTNILENVLLDVNFKDNKKMYLCSLHFVDENFKSNFNGRCVLKDEAIPTLFCRYSVDQVSEGNTAVVTNTNGDEIRDA